MHLFFGTFINKAVWQGEAASGRRRSPVGNWPPQCGVVVGSEALSRPQVHT